MKNQILANIERIWKPILPPEEFDEMKRLVNAGVADDIPNQEFIDNYWRQKGS